MQFTKITKEEFDGIQFRNYKIKEFLEEFLQAGIEYARVQWAGDYKNETVCAQTLKDVVNRCAMPILVKVRNHSVYLVNTQYNG